MEEMGKPEFTCMFVDMENDAITLGHAKGWEVGSLGSIPVTQGESLAFLRLVLGVEKWGNPRSSLATSLNEL